MPYERWILADAWWFVALVAFSFGAKPAGEFQVGAVAAIIVYLWWRHREARKADWFAEIERQIKLQAIAEADEANP